MNVALLCDSPDERWPSMDLVGEMHSAQLRAARVPHQRFAPPIRRRTLSFALDRVLFRFGDYPRLARKLEFDVYHVIDHSYSQLLHAVPPERTVVTCHDVDTFRSVLEPDRVRRGLPFRIMTNRILSGFRKAAHIACDSLATLEEIQRFNLMPANKLSVVPLGVHPACSPDPEPSADREADRLLHSDPGPFLMHVGNTLPRKRIDVLFHVLAAARKPYPNLKLIRVGGPVTPAHQALARALGVQHAIFEIPFIERNVLSALYRRATLVLQPSDAEGFGLPVAEAMACGTPVVASDLKVLREVGGDAAIYCPPGNASVWSQTVMDLLSAAPSNLRSISLAQATQFSWISYSKSMMDVYNNLLNLTKRS